MYTIYVILFYILFHNAIKLVSAVSNILCIAQSVTCLISDPGVASLILAWSHTFEDILLPCADSRRVVVRYKRKYVHEVLVNRLLVKLAQEKVWLGELTIST